MLFETALEATLWKLSAWLAVRLAAPRRCPVPLSDVRGRLTALVHSPQGAALLTAAAVVLLWIALRSAWSDIGLGVSETRQA